MIKYGGQVGLKMLHMVNALTLLDGRVGVNATPPTVTMHISASDAIHIPVGSTAQPPDTAIVQTGMIRYNSYDHMQHGLLGLLTGTLVRF